MFYDVNRTLYVADTTNNRVQRFTYGSVNGTTLPGFNVSSPTALFITNTSVIYVLDMLNYRVVRWINGVQTTVAGGRGSGSTLDKISTSYGVFLDENLNIYISEYSNHRVSFWTAGNTTIGRLVNISLCPSTRFHSIVLGRRRKWIWFSFTSTFISLWHLCRQKRDALHR